MIPETGLDWPRSQAEWIEHVKWWNHQKLMEWQERKNAEEGISND